MRKQKPQPFKYPEELRSKAPAMRAEGMSYRQIGQELGAPLQTVRLWCRGVRKPRRVGQAVLLPHQLADIRDNTRPGSRDFNIGAQAREYGVSYNTVSRIIGRMR